MFTLTFKKSKSPKMPEAMKYARSIGYVVQGDHVVIELTDPELLFNYESLCDLLRVIRLWKNVDGRYDSKPVNPFRFVFVIYAGIIRCSQGKHESADPRHCWRDNDNEGWGCKVLSPFRKEISGTGEYKKSCHFWYNYGAMEDGRWKVDKKLIAQKLNRGIIGGFLNLCPFLDLDRIRDIIMELPSEIPVDGVNFRPYRVEGKWVNIRHTQDHFAFNGRMAFADNSSYADLCMINYLSLLEHDLNYLDISRN